MKKIIIALFIGLCACKGVYAKHYTWFKGGILAETSPYFIDVDIYDENHNKIGTGKVQVWGPHQTGLSGEMGMDFNDKWTGCVKMQSPAKSLGQLSFDGLKGELSVTYWIQRN